MTVLMAEGGSAHSRGDSVGSNPFFLRLALRQMTCKAGVCVWGGGGVDPSGFHWWQQWNGPCKIEVCVGGRGFH